MRLTILTLAHDVYFSEPGKLMNITGIYSGLTAAAFPVVVPKLLLVARFTGSPVEYGREFEIMVTFLDQDGLPGPIPSDRRIERMVMGQSGEDVHAVYVREMRDVEFRQPGWYQFNVHVNGERVDDLPVHVSKAVRKQG